MNVMTRNALSAGLLLAAAFAGSPALAAGKYHVIELTFESRWGKPIVLHFMPPGGFSAKACKASLQPAIAEFSPNLNKAFEKNYGTGVEGWRKAKFIKGECPGLDSPGGQLFKLKLSGQ
ncbi:hypothetical protein [Devosia sp. CN2-171]|uniref:hypothetical protein n=1 Tax=Devosia sp. CN2-171 TaxID=3400909 RepID=UPI003BF8578F